MRLGKLIQISLGATISVACAAAPAESAVWDVDATDSLTTQWVGAPLQYEDIEECEVRRSWLPFVGVATQDAQHVLFSTVSEAGDFIRAAYLAADYEISITLSRRGFATTRAELLLERYDADLSIWYPVSQLELGKNGDVATKASTVGVWTTELYRLSLTGNNTPVRIGASLARRSCGTPANCHGAVGNGCDRNFCTERADGKWSCQVAIGSMMHDTCCSFFQPSSDYCFGNQGRLVCRAPDDTWGARDYRCCSKEWSRAISDTVAGRVFFHEFDPAEIRYHRQPLAFTQFVGAGGNVTSSTTEFSIQPPSGHAIYGWDHSYGWCANGIVEANGTTGWRCE